MFCNTENRPTIQLKGSFFKTLQKIIFTGIYLLVLSKSLQAQYNIDSIKALSYEQFKEYFRKSYVDSVKDLIYANAFLEKAKKNGDTLKMANAYLKLSDVSPYQVGLQYADSSISITSNIIGNENYPASGYVTKGNIYSCLGELQKAVDQYVMAHELAEKTKNNILLAIIKANIGAIKNKLGEKEETLRITKDFISFVIKSEIPNKNLYMANGLFALAATYITLQEYDSANIVVERGIKLSLQENYTNMYAEFLNLCGICLYHATNYKASIDSIQTAIKVHDLHDNISFAYLYLGKSNLALGDTSAALRFFLKVDSFLCNNSFIMQELLEAYSPVIEYYSKKKDYAKQLFYTNQLIKFDSVFDANRINVGKDISKKYDIPLLLASKQKLINELDKDKNLSTRNMYLLFVFSLLLIGVVAYFVSRNRKYKKRFDKLLNQSKEEEVNRVIEDKKHFIKETKTESTPSSLDSELVGSILIKLNEFEKSTRFTNNSYTLNKLAKELKTNSSYLSKIINDHKGQNYPNYLKKLRIDLAIDRLKNEPKFRNFTVQAIAQEVGFKTAQLFSATFYEKTGLYPSYFIKQLEKQDVGTE